MTNKQANPSDGWGRSPKTIIEMGKMLQAMNAEIGSDEFTKRVSIEFGLKRDTAGKIINLSRHPILSDPEFADKLPASWALLYEMKFLPDHILLEKIKSGEAARATKYQVWEWRGVKARRPEGYTPKNDGPRVRVPENVSLVAYINAGVNREAEFNNDAEAVARSLGVGLLTYRNVRAIILLSMHPGLSKSDEEFVQSLIDKINKTRNVREYYLKAKPLIDKIWGVDRGKKFTNKKIHKRIEAYLNAVFLLKMSAERVSDMDKPYMSMEDAEKVITELSETGTIIRKLAENIRRSRNG